MSKEIWKDQEAYDVVFNHFNNCTCQEDKFLVRSALDHIYQALKRNEPMKPLLKDMGIDHYYIYCPSCKEYIGFKNSVRQSLTLKHCPDCGQAIDWSDEK